MTELAADVWLHCSACRKGIPFRATHWVCSVSTCNRARTQLVFCSVSCWDSHVATLRHRDSWAIEARAPTRDEAAAGRGSFVNDYPDASPISLASELPTQPLGPLGASTRVHAASSAAPGRPPAGVVSSTGEPARRVIAPLSNVDAGGVPDHAAPVLSVSFEREVLIVVSKMKKYIRERSGMNTSDAIAEGLSEHVRAVCDDAIRAAAAEGRKTVLERDVPRPRR
jgi:hypothetical protein